MKIEDIVHLKQTIIADIVEVEVELEVEAEVKDVPIKIIVVDLIVEVDQSQNRLPNIHLNIPM